MDVLEDIQALIAEVLEQGSVPGDRWPAEAPFSAADVGLAERDGMLGWADAPDLIEHALIADAFPDLNTTRFDVIDSTNTRLVSLGARTSIASRLYIAEFQHGGRGRRGRTWVSPYGRNLAMSLGVSTQRALPELGGLSVVVGLALADAVESVGVIGVKLKWPNDLLVDGRKLAGILIELVQRPSAVEFVVGMGVNVSFTDAHIGTIDQPVTDLRRCGVALSRTELAIKFVACVRQYLRLFEDEGFSPFVRAFNDLHLLHDQTCHVIQGGNTVSGVVCGIGEQGELILRTGSGEQRFHGGEVSLRAEDA